MLQKAFTLSLTNGSLSENVMCYLASWIDILETGDSPIAQSPQFHVGSSPSALQHQASPIFSKHDITQAYIRLGKGS